MSFIGVHSVKVKASQQSMATFDVVKTKVDAEATRETPGPDDEQKPSLDEQIEAEAPRETPGPDDEQKPSLDGQMGAEAPGEIPGADDEQKLSLDEIDAEAPEETPGADVEQKPSLDEIDAEAPGGTPGAEDEPKPSLDEPGMPKSKKALSVILDNMQKQEVSLKVKGIKSTLEKTVEQTLAAESQDVSQSSLAVENVSSDSTKHRRCSARSKCRAECTKKQTKWEKFQGKAKEIIPLDCECQNKDDDDNEDFVVVTTCEPDVSDTDVEKYCEARSKRVVSQCLRGTFNTDGVQ